MRVHDRLSRWLTRGYARALDFSGVSREETYQSHNEEQKVFWIDAEDWSAAGQCTPFGTILLNEDRLSNVPDSVKDYVFLHEVGHTKTPTILSVASIILRIPLTFLAIIGVPVLIGRWLGFALSVPELGQLTTFTVTTLISVLLLTIPIVLIWWLDEGYAELFAVSKLGVATYQRRHAQMTKHTDRGVIGRTVRWLLYPNPNFVVWIAKRLDVN